MNRSGEKKFVDFRAQINPVSPIFGKIKIFIKNKKTVPFKDSFL